MNSSSAAATQTPARDQINRQIDGELTRARKSHAGYFRGGASVPPVPVRETLPPAVLIVRKQGTSKEYPLKGRVCHVRGTHGDVLAFRDIDAAAEHAKINGHHLRLELDVAPDYPWPRMGQTEVCREQVAAYQASKAEQATKAETAGA